MRATEDLHVCGSCRRPFVVPDAIVSAPEGIGGLVVELRCTDCGWRHTGAYPPGAVEALDRALDLAEREIRAALEICELGLDADLILPEYF